MRENHYTIGEISKLSRINKNTLRFYEEKGLISPAGRNEENNYRLYSEQHVVEAVMINELRELGFSLSEIREYLKQPTISQLEKEIDQKIRSLEEEQEKLQMQIRHLNQRKAMFSAGLHTSDDPGVKPMEVVFEEMPQVQVLLQKTQGSFATDKLQWKQYNDLLRLRDEKMLTATGPVGCVFFADCFRQLYFYEGETAFYLPVEGADPEDPDIGTIGGYTRAGILYKGDYTGLPYVYIELMHQINQNHYRTVGRSHEEYIVTFTSGVEPEEYLTHVYCPVEKIE